MNTRAILFQLVVFTVQWGLMIIGFFVLSKIIAPTHPFESTISFGKYLDAGLKALIALLFSVTWLYLWDRQIRIYFYREAK